MTDKPSLASVKEMAEELKRNKRARTEASSSASFESPASANHGAATKAAGPEAHKPAAVAVPPVTTDPAGVVPVAAADPAAAAAAGQQPAASPAVLPRLFPFGSPEGRALMESSKKQLVPLAVALGAVPDEEVAKKLHHFDLRLGLAHTLGTATKLVPPAAGVGTAKWEVDGFNGTIDECFQSASPGLAAAAATTPPPTGSPAPAPAQ